MSCFTLWLQHLYSLAKYKHLYKYMYTRIFLNTCKNWKQITANDCHSLLYLKIQSITKILYKELRQQNPSLRNNNIRHSTFRYMDVILKTNKQTCPLAELSGVTRWSVMMPVPYARNTHIKHEHSIFIRSHIYR